MILDNFSLVGRHVLVTGAGRGLGAAMAVAAAQAGASVTAVARTAEQLEETREAAAVSGGKVYPLCWDIGRTDSIPALLDAAEANGAVDSVIHAAGTQLRSPAVDLNPQDWRALQTTNAEAPFFLSVEITRRRLVDPVPGGSHIFIGSLASSIGLPNIAPYVVSKSAVLGAVRALSREWAGQGIRVNGIAPGYVHTQLTADLLNRPADYERILARVPMGRLGSVEEIAGAAVFLLSGASSYITGSMLNVDGGWLAA